MAKLDIKNVAEALYEATEGQSPEEQKKVIRGALLLLKKNGQLSDANALVERFTALYDEKNEIARAHISSRKKLTDKDIHEIQAMIKEKHGAKEVIIDEVEDESLLGGVKIKVGDTLYDSTLKKRLEDLQENLLK
jgi:F-type H+-transporting ATPase subunit delta